MFSIITPAYNAEKFIATAIKSVLQQTYKNFEFIIVDDGSADGTKEVVKQFGDKRLVYIHQENAGVSAARNTGILAAKGEYICFLDSDDEWHENHLEEICCLIKEYGDCDFYITGYDIRLVNRQIVHKSQQVLKNIKQERFRSDNGYEVLLKNGYFCHTNSVCCRRNVFDKVGLFAVGVKNGEDDDMWLRIFAYYNIAVSKTITTIYNRENCGATAKRLLNKKNVFMERVGDILSDAEVPDNRKRSLLVWIERHKLSQCRELVLAGRKRDAIRLMKKVNLRKALTKSYFLSLLCLILPTKLVRLCFNVRDKAYYSQE